MASRGRKPSYEELLRENEALRRSVEELTRDLREAERRVEELQKLVYRQAAPFRRPPEERKKSPSRPGRKKGHKGECRRVPDHVDEDRTVSLERCPQCGGPVRGARPVVQYIEDIPPLRTHVTRLVTYVAQCPCCGEVRSTDPLQVSTAEGCARVQIGPRALGLAAELKAELGLTYRKLSRALSHWGLQVSPGGLSQALARVAGRLRGAYDGIARAIRASAVVNADETSWYVGEPGWWLWVFTTPQGTLYLVDEGRGAAVVEAVLGQDYGGTLVSDCLSSYNPIQCKKQKCYSHHLRALSEWMERVPPAGAEVLEELKLYLQTAIILARLRGGMGEGVFQRRAHALREAVYGLLDAPQTGLGIEKALNRFRTHRSDLFGFLEDARVPATNNQAERMLRPAVISRKISCGNKTARGRTTWQVLCSVAATCRQQGRSFLDLVASGMPLQAIPPGLTFPAG
jgi:transposase